MGMGPGGEHGMTNKTKRLMSQSAVYVLVLIVCAWVLAPFAWLAISSTSTRADLTSVPMRWIPERPNFDTYRQIFLGGPGTTSTARDLKYTAFNSIVVAGSVTLVCLLAGSLAAYAFTRLNFRGRNSLFVLILLTQLLPAVVIIIPLYVIMRILGMLDTKLALIVAEASFILPLVIWLMRGYFASVPKGLEEAAMIDGCTRAGAIFHIMIPLSAPGLAASGIFAFIIAWNEFFSAFILSSTLRSKTLSVIISEFSSKVGVDYVAMATAGVLASIPPVVLAILFQRFIVQGLTAGAVKG